MSTVHSVLNGIESMDSSWLVMDVDVLLLFGMEAFFWGVAYLFFHVFLFRDHDVKAGWVVGVFCGTLGCVLSMFGLVLVEVVGGVSASARWFHWNANLYATLLMVLGVVPFSMIVSFLKDWGARGRAALGWGGVGWILFVVAFWKLGDPFPLHGAAGDILGVASRGVGRVGIVGVTLSAALSGVSAVLGPYTNLDRFAATVHPEDLRALVHRYFHTLSLVSQKRRRILAASATTAVPSGSSSDPSSCSPSGKKTGSPGIFNSLQSSTSSAGISSHEATAPGCFTVRPRFQKLSNSNSRNNSVPTGTRGMMGDGERRGGGGFAPAFGFSSSSSTTWEGNLISPRMVVSQATMIALGDYGSSGGSGGGGGGSGGRGEDGTGGILGRVSKVMWGGGSGEGSQEASLSVLKNELEHLDAVARTLYLEVVDAQSRCERVFFAQTSKGRLFNGLGYFFSGFCFYKMLMALINVVWDRRSNKDPVSRMLEVLLRHVHLDEAYVPFWTQTLSLVFVAVLLVLSVRGFLINVTKFFARWSTAMSGRRVVLFLTLVLGCYGVASILLTRMNLPIHARFLLTKVLGSIEFSFYHRWFDIIFLASATLTLPILTIIHHQR